MRGDKPTVEEFLRYAKERGLADDYMRTDLLTGERVPFDRSLLQRWLATENDPSLKMMDAIEYLLLNPPSLSTKWWQRGGLGNRAFLQGWTASLSALVKQIRADLKVKGVKS